MPEVTCEIDFNDYVDPIRDIELCPECGEPMYESTEVDFDVHMIFMTSTCPGCGYTQTEK